MKRTLLVIAFLLLGYLQNFAQNYETFLTEMKKLEKEEKEYSDILFRKNDHSAEYKKGFEPKLKQVRQEKVSLAREALEANPDDKRFVDVLNFYLFNYLSIEELDQALERFSDDARSHPMWKSMKSYVTYKPLNEVGNKSSDFTVKGHDGKKITLSKVLKKNKVVLVDFWASWCGPCRASFPHLKEIYDKYKSQGFEILSVSLDEKADLWEKAFQSHALPWIDGSNLLGWADSIPEKYAVRGIPHKVLIAHDGEILGVGFYKQGEMEETIEKYLQQHK